MLIYDESRQRETMLRGGATVSGEGRHTKRFWGEEVYVWGQSVVSAADNLWLTIAENLVQSHQQLRMITD